MLEEASAAWSDSEGRRPEGLAQQAAGDLAKLHGWPKVERESPSPARPAVDTVVDADTGKVTRGPMMYNDAVEPSPLIDAAAPAGHCTAVCNVGPGQAAALGRRRTEA